MRKQFLLMLILCLTASMVWAERIDVATARKIAQTVAQREGAASGLRSASDLPLVYAAAPGQSGTALRSGTMEGAADYFVFNFPGEKGFAIVAGDDRVRPVLGYSNEGSFDPDNLPENFRGMLAYYQDQITWANNKGIEATPDIAAEWSRFMSGTALRAGGKSVLLETANWDQYDPYNRKTPMFSNEVTEVHAPTGCSATAMGIIMKYYRFPEQANMEKGIASYEGIDISYDKYDWENIPKELNASSSIYEINAVAELLWECGANIHTKYSLETGCASDENVLNAMRDVFGYSLQMKVLDQWLEKYSWEEWKSILRNELDNRHPVLYASSTEQRIDPLSGKGHMFVCDGYDSYDRFHFNWGWGGLYNGFYLLSSLDPKNDLVWGGYNQGHRMIINIKPNNPNENTSSILLRSSLYNIGFEYVEWRGGWYGGVGYTIVNGGNTPFEGYYALVSVDQEENIVDILNSSGITFLDVFSSSQSLTLKDPNVCIMLAYSSNKQDWVLVRGATPEIACKFKPIEGPISEYPIYYDLDVWGEPQITGIEANVIGKLEYGKVGTIQLTPLEGYSLPKTNEIHMQIGSETIAMGNAPATESSSHYDNIYWDENTGIITIPFVAGHVHIDTRGKQVGSDDEIKDLESTSLSFLTYILNGESYEILLGYWKSFTVILPSDIQASPKITLNATAFSSGAQVEIIDPIWIEDTAVGTIIVTSKNGYSKTIYNIAFKQVYSTPPAKPTHTITVVKLDNLTTTPDLSTVQKVKEGDSFEFTLIPAKDYRLPKTIMILNGETSLTQGIDEDYTYDKTTGKVVIKTVTSDLNIIASGIDDHHYEVILNIENLSSDPQSYELVLIGEKVELTLKAQEGFTLPTDIQVTMGGRLLTQKVGHFRAVTTEYTYDDETGRVVIENVDGEIIIEAKGVMKGCFEIVLDLINLTSTPTFIEPQAKDAKIELTLKPSSGYELPGSITVTMGGTTLASGTGYTYDRSTGKFTLEKITGTLVIMANGSRIPDPEPEPEPTPTTYTVTLPVVEGATITAVGSTSVTEGNNFSFTVDVKEGYNADNMVVKANGTTLMPDANGRYTIANVRSNVVVTVSGIVKGDSPTANEAVEPGVLRVWSSGSRLFIQTPVADTAYIVAFDGRLYKTLSLPVGEYTEEMPRGSYIIYIGKQSYKLKF